MGFLIVFPLLLAWALLPASAKPGGLRFGQDQTASAASAPDTVRLASLVNAERSRRGLPVLAVLPRLSTLAGAQSTRMAAAGRLSASRGLADAVQPASTWEEQVRCAASVEAAHRELMRSAGAKRRILSPRFNAIGVGAASAGCVWVTELLAKVPDAAGGTARRPGRPTTTTAATTTTRAAPTTTRPAPEPTAAPTTAAAGSPGGRSTAQKLASDLLDRLNAERRARGLAALTWDGDLARIAGDWSAQMARTGNFSHRDLGAAGGLPGMARFSALGENIAWVEGYPSMGNQLHVGWMRSEGHRANMLQRGFDRVGIGVVCSGGRAWATQNFGRLDTSGAPSMSSSTPAEEPIVATRNDGVRC